jgi:hypothetical protein
MKQSPAQHLLPRRGVREGRAKAQENGKPCALAVLSRSFSRIRAPQRNYIVNLSLNDHQHTLPHTHDKAGGEKDTARHGADTRRGSAEFLHKHKKDRLNFTAVAVLHLKI